MLGAIGAQKEPFCFDNLLSQGFRPRRDWWNHEGNYKKNHKDAVVMSFSGRTYRNDQAQN